MATSTRKKKSPESDINISSFGKVPPMATDMEVAILGAIMLEKNAIDIAAEILQPQSFYVDAHQRIFSAALRLTSRGVQIDILTIVQELRTHEELDLVGGPYAVTKLTNSVTSTANLEVYCRIIQQKFIQRQLIKISADTMSDAFADSTDVFDLLDKHEGKIVELTSGFVKGQVQSSQVCANRALSRIDFLRNNREELSGVTTGFKALNRVTYGWQPTDLIILAARPSVGKTAFALNLARSAATYQRKKTPVAFFSLEISADQLVQRILSAESGVSLEFISRGRVYDDNYVKVSAAAARFSEMDIYIDDTASLNIFEFRAKARRLVSKHGVGLIIIDYLQLMSGLNTGNRENREQEIATISRNLKGLAKELHVPIIALSQMSRAIESRSGNKEPQLSDLRESGAIEQDADIVMFLFRLDYQKTGIEAEGVKGETNLKIAKHRNGALETLAFVADLSTQTFSDEQVFHKVHTPTNQTKPSHTATAKTYTGVKFNGGDFDDGLDDDAPF